VTVSAHVPVVPKTGYEGPVIHWKMNYSGPAFRHDGHGHLLIWVKARPVGLADVHAGRLPSGTTTSALPDTLHLQWRRDLPEARQAWPVSYANQSWPANGWEMAIKHGREHEPIAAGKVFVGSNRDDCLPASTRRRRGDLARLYGRPDPDGAAVRQRQGLRRFGRQLRLLLERRYRRVVVEDAGGIGRGGDETVDEEGCSATLRMISSWPGAAG